jgi:hypothetical protein
LLDVSIALHRFIASLHYSYLRISFFPTRLQGANVAESATGTVPSTKTRGLCMHILPAIAFIIGDVIVLAVALVGVLRDLLNRGPFAAPLLEDDGPSWPPRYQASTFPPDPSERSPPPIRLASPSASERSVAASDLQLR